MMSGSIDQENWVTPEELANRPYKDAISWLKAAGQYGYGVVNSLPASAASALLTDSSQTGVARYVPGIGAQIYHGLSGLSEVAQMAGNFDPITGYNKDAKIYPLPGADTVGEIVKNVQARGRELLAPTPQSSEEASGQGLGSQLLTGGPPLAGAVSRLPTAAREAVMWLAPGIAMPKLNAAAIGGMEALKSDSGNDTKQVEQLVATPQPAITTPESIAQPEPVIPQQSRELDYDASTGYIIDRATREVVPDPGIEWTNGKMLAAGIGAILSVAGMRQAGNVLRARQIAKFPTVSAEFNASLGGTEASTVRAPIPGVLTSDRLAATLTDSTVPLQRFAEAIESNPVAATELKNKVALLTNDNVFMSKVQSFANTGIDPTTNFRMLPWQKHWEKTAALDEAAQRQYTLARNAADELNNRIRSAGIAHNFPTQTDAQLQTLVSDARSNPTVAALLDERRQMSDQMTTFMQMRGMITPAEASKMRSTHRDFLPSSDAKGIIDNPLTARNLEPLAGLDNIKIPAWELDKQHVEAIFRGAEHNDLVGSLVKPALAFQQRNAGNARLFESVAKDGDYLSLAYRDQGELKYVKVNSSELHAWIEGGPTQLGTFSGANNYLRHTLQSATLGPLAWLVGKVAAPKLAIYNGLISTITRPPGTAFGLLDAAAQKAGFKPGIPGDLTGVVLGQPYAIAADGLALAAHATSAVLEPGAGLISKTLRNTFGDGFINMLQNNAEKAWVRSLQYERKAIGNIGSAGQGSTELPLFQPGAVQMKSSALNNTVPELFRSNNPTIAGVQIPIGRAMPFFVRVNSIAHDINKLITESAASHYYRMNRSTSGPTTVLNRQTRDLTGDIGMHGTGTLARAVDAYIPWGNAAVQGTRRLVNNIADHPMQSALGIAHIVGTSALASVFLAASRGPEFVQHLKDELDSEQVGSRVVMHTGETPDQYNFITLPQELRGAYAMALSMAHDLFSNPSDPEIRRMSLAGMADFFQKHITTQNQTNIVHGLMSPLTISPPPVANALLGVAGKNVPNDWVARGMLGKPMMTGNVSQRSTPNIDKAIDPLTETEHGAMFKDITSAFFGALATGGFALYGAQKFARDWTNDNNYAAQQFFGQMGQHAQESLPFANNMVWRNSIPLSISTAVSDRVNAKTQVLSKLSGTTGDIRNDGFTRSRGAPLAVAPGQAHEVPTDPQMFSLYVVMSKIAPEINKLVAPATDIRKQIDAARLGGYDPETKTQIINTLNRQYQQKMRTVDEQLSAFEGGLSQMVGKRVEIDKIDWKKGLEQFTAPNVE